MHSQTITVCFTMVIFALATVCNGRYIEDDLAPTNLHKRRTSLFSQTENQADQDYNTADKRDGIQDMLTSPQAQAFLSDPNVQAFLNDPNVQAISAQVQAFLSQPQSGKRHNTAGRRDGIPNMLTSPQVQGVLNNPNVQAFLNDPNFQAFSSKIKALLSQPQGGKRVMMD
ncbi:unnamed protein product [Adineta steineri]|uniref:Uncharacterized protein n=1 Tax=Adineta steineri TaxID=433720 RepID=A0A819TDB1_9BILA|nr:unnamed protein product [Adineta steineri]CAF4077062.1 unnamed protein product [Adineta steineri]